MAKITLDPKYTEMHGRDRDLVLYRWKGKQCARVYVVPRNPDTAEQRKNRSRFSEASSSWRELPMHTRAAYNKKAAKLSTRMSGFNLYVSLYMKGFIYLSDNGLTLKQSGLTVVFNRIPLSSRSSFDPLRIYSDPACYQYGKNRKRGRYRKKNPDYIPLAS
ncbi:MAG TPA: hypothetical protein PK514_05350 [Spirochaetota bacterium]|nr:hypothetical protein [Spirochaetota bacterium]